MEVGQQSSFTQGQHGRLHVLIDGHKPQAQQSSSAQVRRHYFLESHLGQSGACAEDLGFSPLVVG